MGESGMKFIYPPQPNERVVAVKIDGQLTTEDMKAMIERFQAIVDRGEKALLFIDMQGYDGWEFGVATEKLKHIGLLWKAFDKYAIVGDTNWMEIWVKIVDPLTPQQIRHFSPDKTDEAWAWLLATETAEVV
jgi:hypothetical protein